MDIDQHVELVNEVKGSPVGTKGIVKTLDPLTIQLYPLQNNAILEVNESDLKVIEETQTNVAPKPQKQRRKTAKNDPGVAN